MADRTISVTLRVDAADFKRQFDEAGRAAEDAAKRTESSSKRQESAFGRLVTSAKDNRQAWDTAGTAMAGFGAAILGAGALAAKTGISYNQLQQRAGAALDVLMGSAEAASAQMAKLNEFADTSPFSREMFIEAQQQLIAFGVEADRVVPILSAVQDAVAATGGSNDDISELVRILAQVTSTGKITAETLNQLGYRGVDAAKIIGEQMGYTAGEIRDQITAGTLDADAALRALTDGMSERFGGAAAGVKETFDGALDRVRAAWRDLSAELMAPLISPDGGGYLVDLTNQLADAMRWFQALPEPVKATAAAMVGLTGAGAAAGGAFLLLFPRVMDTIGAFQTLARDEPRLTGGLKSVGQGALVAAGAIAALRVAGTVGESFREGSADTELFVAQLANLRRTGDITSESVNQLASSTVPFGVSVRGVGDALGLLDPDPVSASLEGLTNMLLGVPTTADVAAESIGSVEGALTSLLSSGSIEGFTATFRAAVEDAEAFGYSAEDLIAAMPELQAALTPVATEMGLQADNATLARIAMEGLDPALLAAASSADEFADGAADAAEASISAAEAADALYSSMMEIANAFLGARAAARDYEDALVAANSAAEENGRNWENGTEAARANAEAIDDLSTKALANADAMREGGQAAGQFLADQRQALIEVAMEMGATRSEAERYVDQLGLTPEFVSTQIELDSAAAEEKWAEINAVMFPSGGHPPMLLEADVDPDGNLEEFSGLLDTIPPETGTTIDAETGDALQKTYGFSDVLEGATAPRTVDIWADAGYAEDRLSQLVAAIESAGGTVTINGDEYPADQALNAILGTIDASNGTVTINGEDYPVSRALRESIMAIDRSDGTITIRGDNAAANAATDRAKSKADRTRGTISVSANTRGAESALSRLARRRTATIDVRYNSPGPMPGSSMARSMRAGGGPVAGPGTETSDSIPAMLSNNEHVWAAREVHAAGGHGAIYSLRSQILAGAKTLHLATGGGVENGSVVPARSMAGYQLPAQRAVEAVGGDTYNVYAQNDRARELVGELQWQQRLNRSQRGRYARTGR